MRIALIGNSGSGKSMLSRQLATARALPMLDLDTVAWEPGVEGCVANCRSRPWEPHKYASKQVQDQHLEFLLAWVREYYSRAGDLSLAAHQALFDEYPGTKHKLTARSDAAALAKTLLA